MAALTDRDQHEESIRKQIGQLSLRHRRELIDLLGEPPRYANVPQEFWQRVQTETEQELAILLMLVFIAAATQHGMDGLTANARGFAFAGSAARDISTKWTDKARARVFEESEIWIEDAAATGKPTSKSAVNELAKTAFSPDRVEEVAVTEVTKAASAGSEAGVFETGGTSENDTWFTSKQSNVCPICKPLHNTKRAVWSKLFPGGPPAHPRCNCWIVYDREKQ